MNYADYNEQLDTNQSPEGRAGWLSKLSLGLLDPDY